MPKKFLTETHPSVAKLWHPTKNRPLSPDQITYGSGKKVWWKCPKGPDHEWEASPNSRTYGKAKSGCPFCAGLRPSVTNSLVRFPKLVAELHPTKNGELTADQLVAGSTKNVWWKCPKGPDHEWTASLNNRTNQNTPSGCPCCSGHRVSITNSLATLHPEIARELDPTKNGGLTADKLVAGSTKRVSWKCSKGPDHEWEATLVNRTTHDRGCPFCTGQRVSVTNSLATLHPDIARELDPTKNNGLTANDFTAGSNKKVWWKCAKGPDHEWPATVNSRTKAGNGCPCCAGMQLSVTNSLATLHPEIAAELHPTRNRGLTADRVVAGSTKRVWWKCTKEPDHEWQVTIESRTSQHSGRGGTGCPSCADYGFDVIAPATLYYVKIKNVGKPLYKIGVTNRGVEQRFQKDRQKITVIFTRDYESGQEAKDAESAVIDEFGYALYEGATPFSDGTGTTEIFEFDVLGLDLQD